MRLRHLANENNRARFLPNELAKRLVSESFILSARDENDRFVLREQRRFDRVEIGRF